MAWIIYCLQNGLSSEIFYAALEQQLFLVSVNVLGNAVGKSLGVTHFAEYASVGGDYALDRAHGTVRVKHRVHSGIALKVDVLCEYLSVVDQLAEDFAVRDKSALAVRNGYRVDIADLAVREPRRLVRAYLGVHELRLVTSDLIVSQRRTFLGKKPDVSERH